jgi:hypothetical protein
VIDKFHSASFSGRREEESSPGGPVHPGEAATCPREKTAGCCALGITIHPGERGHWVATAANSLARIVNAGAFVSAERRHPSNTLVPPQTEQSSRAFVSAARRSGCSDPSYSKRWSPKAVAKPTVAITPVSLPPCLYASGSIVLASMVRIVAGRAV